MFYKFKNNTFMSMGVINITPNSFSNADNLNSTYIEAAIKHTQNYSPILDFGFESTAPMSKAVNFETEWSRVEEFFLPYLGKIDPIISISIDTYKEEVFYKIYDYFRINDFKNHLIWNDVSGKIPNSINELFCDKKFSYVFSHNLAPSRIDTSNHMNFIDDSKNEIMLENCVEYFNAFASKFENFKEQYYFDFCFGFSKNRTQNIYLLKNIATIFDKIKHHQYVIGLSRKSFLRFPVESDVKTAKGARDSDLIAFDLMANILNSTDDKKFAFRTHMPTDIEQLNFLMNSYY